MLLGWRRRMLRLHPTNKGKELRDIKGKYDHGECRRRHHKGDDLLVAAPRLGRTPEEDHVLYEDRRSDLRGRVLRRVSARAHGYRALGLATEALPSSVRRSSNSASRALARLIESAVVSTQPPPVSSPVWTLPACNNASCWSMLACSCLHHAMKRSGAAMTLSQ